MPAALSGAARAFFPKRCRAPRAAATARVGRHARVPASYLPRPSALTPSFPLSPPARRLRRARWLAAGAPPGATRAHAPARAAPPRRAAPWRAPPPASPSRSASTASAASGAWCVRRAGRGRVTGRQLERAQKIFLFGREPPRRRQRALRRDRPPPAHTVPPQRPHARLGVPKGGKGADLPRCRAPGRPPGCCPRALSQVTLTQCAAAGARGLSHPVGFLPIHAYICVDSAARYGCSNLDCPTATEPAELASIESGVYFRPLDGREATSAPRS